MKNSLSKAHVSSLINNGSGKGASLPLLTARYFLMTEKGQQFRKHRGN
jgi:hypothetical protein